MLCGCCLLVFGGSHPTTALFVLTTSVVGTALLVFTYWLLPDVTPSWTVFFIFYMVYGNGAVLGIGSTYAPQIGVIVQGCVFGYFCGFLINLTLVDRYTDTSLVNTIVTCSTVLLCTVLAYPLYDYAVIVSSCFVGSYMAWRVSFFPTVRSSFMGSRC